MQMTPRRHSRGFTLVELMVVIGILGILVGVLAVAVIPALDDARNDLDAQELSKFQQKLALAMGDSSKRRFIRGVNPSSGKAMDVFLELVEGDAITADDFGLLAGGSGDKAGEATIKSGAVTSQDNVIFTGPKSGAKLLEVLDGTMKEGVVMCYNKHWYKKYKRMVLLFPKEKTAKAMPVIELKNAYKAVTQQEVNLKGDWEEMDTSFYKKPPFQNVEPE